MLKHGGRLLSASARYGIPIHEWLDLSTGISPWAYPVLPVPADIWRRLPEDEDALPVAAASYYGSREDCLLPVAGSQAAIQVLPRILRQGTITMLTPAYAEHEHAWTQNGHTVVSADDKESLLHAAKSTRHVLLCNPNNPTATSWSRDELETICSHVERNGGTLIIDEAFMDATPEQSFIDQVSTRSVVVLRSLGKFFGLAGARVGFLFAERHIIDAAREQLGPWTIAGPCRLAATAALNDFDWQAEQQKRLQSASKELCAVLEACGFSPSGRTDFFAWVRLANARAVHNQLCSDGILTRLFEAPESLRFGLPGTDEDLAKLQTALQTRAYSKTP